MPRLEHVYTCLASTGLGSIGASIGWPQRKILPELCMMLGRYIYTGQYVMASETVGTARTLHVLASWQKVAMALRGEIQGRDSTDN